MKEGFDYKITYDGPAIRPDLMTPTFMSFLGDVQQTLIAEDPMGSATLETLLPHGPNKCSLRINTVLDIAHTDRIVADAAQRHMLIALALRAGQGN